MQDFKEPAPKTGGLQNHADHIIFFYRVKMKNWDICVIIYMFATSFLPCYANGSQSTKKVKVVHDSVFRFSSINSFFFLILIPLSTTGTRTDPTPSLFFCCFAFSLHYDRKNLEPSKRENPTKTKALHKLLHVRWKNRKSKAAKKVVLHGYDSTN